MTNHEATASNPRTDVPERTITPSEAVDTSNRDVITAIYAAAHELPPVTLVQETNGSRAYIDYAGLIRLVYDGEREQAEDNPYNHPVNPAVDKLSELVASGNVSRNKIPAFSRRFKPQNDPLYEVLDKAWPQLYSFTDASTGNVICFSVKADAYDGAPTVLISPEHVEIEAA